MRQTLVRPRRWAFLAEHRAYRDVAELLLVALAFLLYFVVRANVIDRADLALSNARQIVDLEKTLGIFREPRLQFAILDQRLLVKLFNFVYFWLDFPLIAIVGLFMYIRRRRWYTFTRDAILFTGALALIAYNLFPVAPPRLLPESGLLDTLQAFSNLSYQAQSTQFFVNPYAAMPSLHVGWATWSALAMLPLARGRWLKLALILDPIVTVLCIAVTGNHWLLDAVGGWIGLAVAWGVVVAWERRRAGARAPSRDHADQPVFVGGT